LEEYFEVVDLDVVDWERGAMAAVTEFSGYL